MGAQNQAVGIAETKDRMFLSSDKEAKMFEAGFALLEHAFVRSYDDTKSLVRTPDSMLVRIRHGEESGVLVSAQAQHHR